MISTSAIYNKRLFVITKKGRLRKHGRIRSAVFYPGKKKLAGFMVKRPDFLWMVKRRDRFIAADSLSIDDEGQYYAELDNQQAWDRGAEKRLDIDLDECIIWEGMDVKTTSGDVVGTVSEIIVADDYAIESMRISDGGMVNQALLGQADIKAADIRGYMDDCIVINIDKRDAEVAGGLAGKAGEAWAKSTHAVTVAEEDATNAAVAAIEKSGEAAGKAAAKAKAKIDEVKPKDMSAEAAGKAAGKHLKKVGGMFGAFKEEFDKASK